MGSAAANAPLAMEVLAVQKLFYDVNPHPLIAILLIWSSQCVGYGFAGLMRRTLVFPTKVCQESINLTFANLSRCCTHTTCQ